MKPKTRYRTVKPTVRRMPKTMGTDNITYLSYPANLVADIEDSMKVRDMVKDDQFAREVYSALCNMQWLKVDLSVDDFYKERMLKIIAEGNTYRVEEMFTVSWRTAGGIVADMRNKYHNASEDYMDWYCAGNEGEVSERVSEAFEELGWLSRPWPEQS